MTDKSAWCWNIKKALFCVKIPCTILKHTIRKLFGWLWLHNKCFQKMKVLTDVCTVSVGWTLQCIFHSISTCFVAFLVISWFRRGPQNLKKSDLFKSCNLHFFFFFHHGHQAEPLLQRGLHNKISWWLYNRQDQQFTNGIQAPWKVVWNILLITKWPSAMVKPTRGNS